MCVRFYLPIIVFVAAAASPAAGQQSAQPHDPQSAYPIGFEQVERTASVLDQAEELIRAELSSPNLLTVGLASSSSASPDAYLLLTQLSQFWDAQAGDWMDESLVTYTRSSDGRATQLLIQNYDPGSSAFVDDFRRRFVETPDSSLTFDEEWDSGSAAWLPVQRRSSTTDEQGNVVSVTEIWDEDQPGYMTWNRTTQTLDDRGQVVTHLFESALFGPLGPSLRYTFTYTDDGQTASRLHDSYNRTTGEFETSGLREWTYDSNGQEVLDMEFDWDENAGEFVNSFRTTTEFTPNSSNPTLVVETEQPWDETAGAWVNRERTVTSVTGSEITETEQDWDAAANNGQGDWVNTEQSIATLQDGRLTQVINQEWDPGQGVWVNETRDSVETDDQGLVTSSLRETWDGANWVNESLLTMTYGEFETPTATEHDLPIEGYALGVSYPNPFTESTTITFTLPSAAHVTLEVFDMLGRSVEKLVETTLSTGTHTVTMTAGDLPGGLYMYRISSGPFEATRSMLVVK